MAKNVERAVKFLLNHHSFLPEAEGVMGQTIEVRRDIAEKLLARGGGRIIEQQPEPERDQNAS